MSNTLDAINVFPLSAKNIYGIDLNELSERYVKY